MCWQEDTSLATSSRFMSFCLVVCFIIPLIYEHNIWSFCVQFHFLFVSSLQFYWTLWILLFAKTMNLFGRSHCTKSRKKPISVGGACQQHICYIPEFFFISLLALNKCYHSFLPTFALHPITRNSFAIVWREKKTLFNPFFSSFCWFTCAHSFK